jgi:hypothetical protein
VIAHFQLTETREPLPYLMYGTHTTSNSTLLSRLAKPQRNIEVVSLRGCGLFETGLRTVMWPDLEEEMHKLNLKVVTVAHCCCLLLYRFVFWISLLLTVTYFL